MSWSFDMLSCIDNEGRSMQYLFIAEESAARNETQTTSPAADCNEIRLVAPQRWATKVDPRWGQSSFDLHRGLDMSEDQIDTIPAELLDELFNR